MDYILFEKTAPDKASFPFISIDNKNLSFISHYHKEIEIIYAQSGSITLFSGKREIVLSEGEFCIFMPYEIHGFRTVVPNTLMLMKINPDTSVEQFDFQNMRLLSNLIKKTDENYTSLKNAFLGIISEHTEKNIGYEYSVNIYKNTILLTAFRNMEWKYRDTEKYIDFLNSVNSFLEENFERNITLSEIARECHLSEYYFSHKFKEFTGMSFIPYLTAFRLGKAIEMLKTGDLKITQIAIMCGFGNLRSFNRSFMSAYKCTPSEYRKKGM